MAIPMFLAMTGAEWMENQDISARTAWMACHFSPYGTGLSNRPERLPPGSMLILNDRTPICGHDPELIATQLTEIVTKLSCDSLLLDFQRPNEPETDRIVDAVLDRCPCPVAVTEYYAGGRSCPIFLPPAPPNIPVIDYLAQWQSREIWLEAALDGVQITVTSDGAHSAPLPPPEPGGNAHADETLHCHYEISIRPDRVQFHLYRTPEDIPDLLNAAKNWGVTRAVGLFQELRTT